MDERLLRHRHVEQGVALRRPFAEPAAEQQHEVGRLHARQQLRIGTAGEVAGIARMQRVHDMGAAERGRDRDVEALGKPHQRGARRLRPAAAAGDDDRPLGRGEQLPHAVDLGRARRGLDRLERRHVGHADALLQHVLRQRDHHRTRAGRWSRCRRRARPARGCARDRRSRSPIWRSSRTPRGSRVPGTPRARACRAPTWPTNRIIGVEFLSRDMQAGRGIGRARPAGDEADAGPAGRLADRLRHHRCAALLAAHRQLDRAAIHAVERGDIALARHAEHMAHAMDDELIGEDLAACPACRRSPALIVSPCCRRRSYTANG